jgi:hypothetical protein
MLKRENIIIYFAIIFGLTMSGLTYFDDSLDWLKQPVGTAFFACLILISIIYAFKTKSLKYIIAFVLLVIEIIAGLFKILHLPGAGILIAIGLMAPFYIAVIFLITAYTKRSSHGNNIIYNVIISLIIFTQAATNAKQSWRVTIF